MVRAWHGRGMASVNDTRHYCVNQMGKTHSKPLAAWHGRGTVWARHGHGMLYVNPPYESMLLPGRFSLTVLCIGLRCGISSLITVDKFSI
jgi:hypothetical protein